MKERVVIKSYTVYFIECPSCETRIETPDDYRKLQGTYKCSKCGLHICGYKEAIKYFPSDSTKVIKDMDLNTKILELLSKGSIISERELSRTFNKSRKTIHKRVISLLNEGLVEKIGEKNTGGYKTTQKGLDSLSLRNL